MLFFFFLRFIVEGMLEFTSLLLVLIFVQSCNLFMNHLGYYQCNLVNSIVVSYFIAWYNRPKMFRLDSFIEWLHDIYC